MLHSSKEEQSQPAPDSGSGRRTRISHIIHFLSGHFTATKVSTPKQVPTNKLQMSPTSRNYSRNHSLSTSGWKNKQGR